VGNGSFGKLVPLARCHAIPLLDFVVQFHRDGEDGRGLISASHLWIEFYRRYWITTISFEETRNLTTANLTFAFFLIMPHLPRPDRINHLRSRTTQLLFGGKGLATIHGGARLSTEAQDQRLALRKFL